MSPGDYEPAGNQALKDCVLNLAGGDARKKDVFYLGYSGSFGDNHATPRTLRADKLGKMVCLEGIVTRCTSPLLSRSLPHRRV